VTVCVYALTPPFSRSIRVRGVEGESLRAITVGSMSAVVGDLRTPPEPSPDRLTRYDDVIRRLAQQHSAVLPARFATCLEDDEELAFILDTRQASFRRALRHVRNRAQMTVRIVQGAGSVAKRPGGRGQGAARGQAAGARRESTIRPLPTTSRRTGRDYLRDKAATAAREREIAGFEPVRGAVQRWVRDERVEKRDRIATIYHLVPRGAAVAYTRAARAAASREGLRAIISGPFPPYAFAGW
jgi:hypothetical protein